MDNINFGIDLGTTNSGIGKYENGRVQVLKNPVGLREILPSVVSFRKGRILVGDKAREQYLTNAENVFSAFKRKMGTNEKYTVSRQDEVAEVSPVDLSSYVLKELQNYTHGAMDAAVITIPASFDTIQANATKEAGYKAGFKEIVLLQEPIAACLAYANLSHLNLESEQKWLVYDFGGGTFDTALVYINQRELKVLDNKGNNFLGGVDIDYAFITQIIIPKLSELTGDSEIWAKILRREGVYEKLWHYLNYLAEEAKKQLSMTETTWLEINFPELDIVTEFEIEREIFNTVVRPKYQETERFVLELLTENKLNFNDIERIILVGGTTYIPFIKDSLKKASRTIIDDSIDPTTAVIIGAAYYAGAHPKSEQIEAEIAGLPGGAAIDVKLSFEAYSNDRDELIAFKTSMPFSGYYRIIRTDGGFDSGLREFDQTASEFVALLPKTKNSFSLTLFNQQKKEIYNTADIAISQGLYNVSGQLLPADICIELDNNDNGTYLEVIFKRNSILPLTKTIYKTFSKSITVNSADKVIINVVEGKGGTMPGANLSIGYIELSGDKIESDLIQGTDIELQLSMDESRGLTVSVYIQATGQEMKHSFHIAGRDVSVEKIGFDIAQAETLLNREMAASDKDEAYEVSAMFQAILKQLQQLRADLATISHDEVTAEKYRIDERKRKLLAELDGLTRARDVYSAIQKYQEEKESFIAQKEHANDLQTKDFERLTEREKELLQSNDKHLIGRTAEELKALNDKVFNQNPENFARFFWYLRVLPISAYRPGSNVAGLFEAGQKFIDEKNYPELKHIVIVLYTHLNDSYKKASAAEDSQLQQIQLLKMGLK